MSKIEYEALVRAASRGIGETKTGNSKFWEHVKVKYEELWQDKVTSSKQKVQQNKRQGNQNYFYLGNAEEAADQRNEEYGQDGTV